MDSNNVIQFPVRSDLPRTKQEVEHSIETFREEYFDLVAQELANEVFFKAAMMGFDVMEGDTIKDCYLVIETLKSVLMKTKGLHSPLQDLAEVMMHVQGDPIDEDWVDNLDD